MALRPCWNCGAPPRCERCGSTERRKTSTGCAECHRRTEAKRNRERRSGLTSWEQRVFNALDRDPFEDIMITQPARAYLRAFNAFLVAVRAGDSHAAGLAAEARRDALDTLEDAAPLEAAA